MCCTRITGSPHGFSCEAYRKLRLLRCSNCLSHSAGICSVQAGNMTRVPLSIPMMVATGSFMAALTLFAFTDILGQSRWGVVLTRYRPFFKILTVVLWLAHVYEAQLVFGMCKKKGLPQRTTWTMAALAFIFGQPVVKAVKAVRKTSR